MIGVLTGFAIIGVVIGVGYVVGRTEILGEHAPFVLSRIAFFVLSPFLLFSVIAAADVRVLFSSLLATSAIAAVTSGLLFALVAAILWRRPTSETVIGTLASGYVNANNIGIPVAVYVLGSPAFAAPIILLQMLVFAPIALTVLDVREHGTVSWRRVVLQPLRTPITIASILGVIVAVSGITLPDAVLAPFEVIGAAAVPIVLIAFGMSLHGQRPLSVGSSRRDIILASVLKIAVMPTVAWLAGTLLGLDRDQLFAVTVLAALPSAQNVFNYAQRYGRGVILARDVVLITTIASLPALVLIAALLAPV
jgi:malonate transporter